MNVELVQFAPELFEKEKNLNKIKKYAQKSDSEIIVFPELATTGYFFLNREESTKYAEPVDGDTCLTLQDIATTDNKIVIAGFAEKDGKNVYNSAIVCFPDKECTYVYRKTHLFYKEINCFDPGNSGYEVVDYEDKNVRVGAMICYDWRFPEASRSLALKGADIIVCPSNLVTDVWHVATPARALENKVYLAVANRTGRESREGEELYFNGMSAVYGYNGSLLCKASEGAEESIITEINPLETRQKSFNSINNIFDDRRPEMYYLGE